MQQARPRPGWGRCRAAASSARRSRMWTWSRSRRRRGPLRRGAQRHGMILPFVKLVVTFRDIRYFVPMPGEVHPFVVSLAPPYAY